ncbi:hypothetical protein [Myceligenerans indicum]|uniref:Uncharacterized protein n=1 Tax=Myceligenerans indicum TaxID=2593663 RepID=A0ABS1LQV6_9MICO|nr:hypothetical protein [Myceligenerans indicum]MBL0888666.1 hypothetical protein [Myceligenerans indicum]
MVGGGRSRPSSSARSEADWDETEEDPGPSYTWLHYVILVVVAFVLGLLIWKLVLEKDSTYEPDEAAQLITSVLPGVGLS